MTARGRLPKPAFVPPTNRLTLVTVYSALDITACIGLFFLIVLGARIKGLRSNFVLLNFEFVLFLTALGQTLLIWTGHALSDDPPRIMCVVSGAFLAATAVFKAAAAFSLTYKVLVALYLSVACGLSDVGIPTDLVSYYRCRIPDLEMVPRYTPNMAGKLISTHLLMAQTSSTVG
jgi:hypothetical protein